MEKLNCSVYDISDSIENLIEQGACVPLYVSGSSMNPFLISRRDIVYLTKHKENDLTEGKILLFKRNDGKLVLHRLKKINDDGNLVLNGDAQTWCETIDKEQVIAAVSEIERKGRRKSSDSLYWKILNCFWKILTPFRSPIMRVWFKFRRLRNKN